MRKYLVAMLLSLSFAVQASAADIKVENAWARATAPGQDTGMAMAVISSKQAATLVGASSKVCKTVELHSMVTEGGMMQMRQVEAIDLPAGQAVDLEAQGYHLMLIGLKKPLQEGKKISLTLKVRTANGKEKKVKFSARVIGMTANKPQAGHAAMSHEKMPHEEMSHEHMKH